MPMTDDQIANLYEKHFQIAPVASRTKGNDVEPVVMRSDRPAPAKVAQRYQEQLVGAGYLVEQADAYESLLTAHARRMAPLFGETPAEYLERRMAGFFGMTPEEFEANWRSGMSGALYQAAMYRSKAQSVGEFINEALAAPPAGAAPFFQQPNKFGKTVIELGSYQVRHIRNEHPDFVEWERIPEVIESGGERVEIGKNRVTGTEAFVYALSDGESTLVVVAAPDVGGKGKKDKKTRTVILTAFRENSAAVENWIANKKAAFSQSTGELLPNPDMRDVNPSGPQSGVGTSISQIDEEVNSLLGKGKSFEQPAFQGSPTRGIDSMSTDFIGTGEGAQAYGWGMYYTQSRDVGEWYRKKLSGGLAYRLTVDGDSWGVYTHDGDNASNWVWYSDDSDPPLPIADTSSAEYRALETLRKAGGDKDAAIAEVRETAEYEGIDAAFADEVISHLNNLEEAERGQLYEAEIPDDDVLLDWDKPLSEQLEHVKSALRYFADTSADVLLRKRQHPWISPIVRRALSDDWHGSYLMRELQLSQLASEALNSIGIPGLRYLDGTSRSQGEGSHNFVIWNDESVKILKTFYQFAGENSRISEPVRANLAKARELAATGTDNEAIRQKTGWFKGMDGKWRYEIPDDTDKLDFNAYGVKGETLGDIYDNPELYRAYPELAGIRVDIQAGREDYSGTLDRTENKIILYGVSINDFETAKRTLLHEIQHVIQDIENFGIGANLKMFRLRLAPNVERLQNELLGQLPQNSCLQHVVKSINAASLERQMADYGTEETILLTNVAAARRDEFASELDLAQRLPGKLGITPEQAQEYSQLFNRFIDEFEFSALLTPAIQYLLTAGEIEARDAASRSSLSDEERAAKAPDLRDDAIVTFGREQVASFSLEQQKSRGPRGAIRRLDDGRWLVGLFRNRDASTIIHETGHFFMEQLREAAGLADAPQWVADSWAKLQKAYGFAGFPTDMDEWTRVQERFATDFEVYMREGKAPSHELRDVFECFSNWLTDIYRNVKSLLGDNQLSPDVREVFDRLLKNENQTSVPQPNNIVQAANPEKTAMRTARKDPGKER